MTTDDLGKIFERIQKLHRKAESAKAIGSEQEALAFAEGVQKMLLKYDLEMSDVEAAQLNEEDPVKSHVYDPAEFGLPGKKTKVTWQVRLAMTVTKAHSCKILVLPGSNRLIMVGRRRDRLVAEHVLVVLTRFCLAQAEKDYVRFFYACRDGGSVEDARGYKAGWYIGFVLRLAQRYQEEESEAFSEAEQAGHGMAVVRVKDQLAKVTEVTEQLTSGKTKLNTPKTANAAGLERGHSRADEVQLRGTGVASGTTGGQVGQGQRTLGGNT